jgi:hypothetical protein
MNVITTALNDRPVKNRSLLPQPRSAPVLERSNVKTPANQGLYPLPNDPIPPALPLSHPPMTQMPIARKLEDAWRGQASPVWRCPKTFRPRPPLAPSPPRFSGETKTAWEAVLGICRGGKGPQGRASGRERVTRWGGVVLIKTSGNSNQFNHGPGSGKNVFIRAIRAIRGQPEPFPRGVGVLACRLPHRPGACLFSPRAQSPEHKASEKPIRLHPGTSGQTKK